MAEYAMKLQNIADRIRINSIKATNASNSGHPTSCASMAEIIAVLFMDVMKYHPDNQRNPNDDRFVLSKGHAAPGLYAAWVEAGMIQESDLMNLRKINSDLEGHPTPRLPFIDVATGSLGQGLSCAAGMAYTGKYLDHSDYRVYCIIGDGESAEGSIWEALAFASNYKLDNLVIIFDVNRLGQSQATAYEHDIDVYAKRAEAFGCHPICVNGHDILELKDAFDTAKTVKGKPTAIIAKTFKGASFPDIVDSASWHGKPLSAKADGVIDALEKKIESSAVSGSGDHKIVPKLPESDKLKSVSFETVKLSCPPSYTKGQSVATRAAYGTALVKIGENCSRVIALDADVKNSTFSIKFLEKFPERFIECFIAEQNMIGVAIGCGTRHRTIPFVSTFGAFFSRGFDQLRMGAISQTNCNFVGSHAGISIGEDGPSQMALEDLAMFRSVAGSTVFYPSDAVSTERAVELAANTEGVCFIRTGRPNAAVIYDNNEEFQVGQAKVVHSGAKDILTVVGAGVTLYNALDAAKILHDNHNMDIKVVDIFTVKPIDSELLAKCVKETHGRLIVVEDHYYEGGIGEAVISALASLEKPTTLKFKHLAVGSVPRSGKPEELLAMFGIDANAIVEAALKLVKE